MIIPIIIISSLVVFVVAVVAAIAYDAKLQTERWETRKRSFQREAHLRMWHHMCIMAQATGYEQDKQAARAYFEKHILGIRGND